MHHGGKGVKGSLLRILRTMGIGEKIVAIPFLAILALLIVKGVDLYMQERLDEAGSNGLRGSQIAVLLNRQLFLENRYVSSAEESLLTEIDSNNNEIMSLLAVMRESTPGYSISSALDVINGILGQHKEDFSINIEVVRGIKESRSQLYELFHRSDGIARKIIDEISFELFESLVSDRKISAARREFGNALKEYIGFSSASILNINDLIAFSNENRFIEAEKSLSGKTVLGFRACDDLSVLTGNPNDREKWMSIVALQDEIRGYRNRIYSLWKTRQELTAKLEAGSIEVQGLATHILAISKLESTRIRRMESLISDSVIALTVLVLALFTALVIKSITRPLVRATEVIVELTKGHIVDYSPTSEQRGDEIGELEESIGRMITNSKEIEEMARMLAMGNYNINITPRSLDDNLSRSLVTMTGALRVMNEELNRKSEHLGKLVSERTLELQRAVEALRESEERFRFTFEQAAVGIAHLDTDGRWLRLNRKLCDIIGYNLDELHKRTFKDITHPDDMATDDVLIQDMLDGRIDMYINEKRYFRKNGDMIWVNITVSLVSKPSGEPDYFISVIEDITGRKTMEVRLRKSLHEKEVLIKEVHHRVKNNMAIISSLHSLQSRRAHSSETLKALLENQNRIRSMALVHERLYQSENLSEINIKEYIETLVNNLSLSLAGESSRINLSVDSDDIFMNIDSLIPCGLIINELVTNSIKYAFLDGQQGEIGVSLKKDSDGLCTLAIWDNGMGIPEHYDIERADTLGLQIVNTLIAQLEGEIEMVSADGVKFRITFKEAGNSL